MLCDYHSVENCNCGEQSHHTLVTEEAVDTGFCAFVVSLNFHDKVDSFLVVHFLLHIRSHFHLVAIDRDQQWTSEKK